MRQISSCYPAALHRQRGDVRWRCSSGATHPDIKPIPVPLPSAPSRAGWAPEPTGGPGALPSLPNPSVPCGARDLSCVPRLPLAACARCDFIS